MSAARPIRRTPAYKIHMPKPKKKGESTCPDDIRTARREHK